MSIIKAAVPLIIGAIGSRGLALLLRIVVAASLTINAYSEYALEVALFITLMPLATLSIAIGLSKLSSGKDLEILRISATASYYIVLSLSILATFIFYFLLPAEISHKNAASLIACVLIGFISQGVISIEIGTSMAKLDTKRASRIELIDSGIKLIVCISFIKIDHLDFIDLFSAYAASSILTAIVIKPKIDLSLSGEKLLCTAKSLAQACAIYSACSLTIFIFFYHIRENLYSIDKTLAAKLDLAIVLYSIPKMIMVSFVRAAIPLNNSGKYQGISRRNILALTALCGIASFFLILAEQNQLLSPVFKLVSIEEYSSALTPLSILILGAAFDLSFGIKSGILFSQNNQRVTLAACIFSVLLLYPTVAPVLNLIGLTGAATIMAATYAILLLSVKIIEKFGGVNFEAKNK